MLWLVWPISAPSLLQQRPETSLTEPLHVLPFPNCICLVLWRPFTSVSGMFGHGKKACAKSSPQSKECKNGRFNLGVCHPGMPQAQVSLCIEWYNIYPPAARLPNHVAWQSDMQADYSLTCLERHTYQAACLPTFERILI